jgi:HD-GYP domain-containing protein (c-di-GMP phosphodiesterase class II)
VERALSQAESSETVLRALNLPTQFVADQLAMPAGSVLGGLLASSLVLDEDWDLLPVAVRQELLSCREEETLLELLVQHDLLTRYQADRIGAGKTFGLVLGNYRILERIGAGGMGVVYRGEHVRMRRQVAIKVLPPIAGEEDPRHLQRFRNEMRAVAQLNHPNIVTALDDGVCTDPAGDFPALQFFVMEYVPGLDLEQLVLAEGPLDPARACSVAYQIASALAAAQRHNIVHRDIKPSNIRITPDGQAKVLDFGLVRQFGQKLTLTGSALGTPEYLAPEQARDATTVDIRADLYGLGGTLFWCLTRRAPFVCRGNLTQILAVRMTQSPPALRSLRPDLPVDLEGVVARLMANDPEERYPTPQAVMNALLGFLDRGSHERILAPAAVLEARRQPELERALTARDAELIHLRNALVLGLADLASHRDSEKLSHFMRLQRYCRWLAEEAACLPAFAGQIDAAFIQMLETCAPLHDIGKVGLPDHILAKAGGLETTERLIMQTHTALGAETLQRVAHRHGPAVAFLQMAIDIARHHHERFDGTGYPDRLAGQAIPLAARIFTIGDVYDALRSRQPYKPALPHAATLEIMLEGSVGQFDPLLLDAFRRCAARFEQTYQELTDFPH